MFQIKMLPKDLLVFLPSNSILYTILSFFIRWNKSPGICFSDDHVA